MPKTRGGGEIDWVVGVINGDLGTWRTTKRSLVVGHGDGDCWEKLGTGWKAVGDIQAGDRLWQMPFAAWLEGTRPGLDWHYGEHGKGWGISNGDLDGDRETLKGERGFYYGVVLRLLEKHLKGLRGRTC